MSRFVCTSVGLGVALAFAGSSLAQTSAGSTVSSPFTYAAMSGLSFQSARDLPAGARDVPAGESFGAAVLAQDSASAYFIDDDPDVFGFGAIGSGGANLITGATTTLASWQTGNDVIVAAYTDDSSDWLPFFEVNAGDPLTAIRFDVGGFAAPGSISYPGFSPADVISVEFVLFIDGGAVFSGGPAATDFSTGLGAVAVVNGASDVGIDEVQMIFHLNVPTPGTFGAFAVAGLVAVRRRR